MMKTRREFLYLSAGAGIALQLSVPAFGARAALKTPEQRGSLPHATVITQVFGNGIRVTGLALDYPYELAAKQLKAEDFSVKDRTITGVFTSTSADPQDRSDQGKYIIIELSPEDSSASLAIKDPGPKPSGKPKSKPGGGGGGMGKAGSTPPFTAGYRKATLEYQQLKPLSSIDDQTIAAQSQVEKATAVKNLIADDFHQLEFHDEKTGRRLKYNLFIPAHYTPDREWPLVLFMHDAGATSNITTTTLYQGLGAIAWASPDDQAARPCFVLAPQYEEVIADDDSHTSVLMDTTINLIEFLSTKYKIDPHRRYTTGQSGGCMTSIAMDIKYPHFFAASFLVAGQWDVAKVKPLAQQKLWIIVSEDDAKAWPGQNAIVAELEKQGAKVTRAQWDGTWNKEQFQQAFDKVDAHHTPINYITFRKGTVIPPGTPTEGAPGHTNTWRIAYTIEPVRAWIFRQHA